MEKGFLLRMILFPAVGIGCGILSNFLPDWAHATAFTMAVLLVLDKIMTALEERE